MGEPVAIALNTWVRFQVQGRPQQKGSKRSVYRNRKGGGVNVYQVDANERARPWQQAVAGAARMAMAEAALDLFPGPVMVQLFMSFARPQNHYGTGRNRWTLRAAAPGEMATTPDIDKLVRTVLDGLSGTVFRDDCQVVELVARKVYDTPEGVDVYVEALK
jgi:Holliday junction resolvase RusA-like endonuclease